MPPEQMPVDNSPEFEALLLQNDENAQVNQNQLDSLLIQGEEGNNELKSINQTLKEESEKVKKVQVVLPEDENELAQNFFKMLRGPKGNDGYSPVKGKDYYTKEEIAEVVKEIQDSIRIPEDGLDGYTPVRGEDYFTDEDISSMVDDVFSRIPTPKDGKDAEVDYEMIISECIARIPKPKNGKNGKNSAEMTSEQILDKIRGLLSYNDLKDLPTLWKNVASRDYDLTELKDVSITNPTNGQVLKYNSTTRKWTNDTDTGGAPGGSDTEVQFNDGGSFGGDAGLTYNKTTDTLTVGGGLVVDTNTLVVDTTNNRTGLLTTAPTHSLTLGSTATGIALYNTADQTTNYERALLYWSSNSLRLDLQKAGTGTLRNFRIGVNASAGSGDVVFEATNSSSQPTLTITSFAAGIASLSCSSGSDRILKIKNTNSGQTLKLMLDNTLSASSGTQIMQEISPTVSQSGTAGYTQLLINPTESSTGSGAKRLVSAQVGSVDKFVVDNAGNTTVVGNIIATKQIYYAAEIDNGNSGASDTIDWTLGNIQKTTMTADCTYTFTAPTGPGHYTLRIIQDGTGNWTATLPSGKWTSGIVPLIKDTASKWTILSVYYDGSAYSYSVNPNLS